MRCAHRERFRIPRTPRESVQSVVVWLFALSSEASRLVCTRREWFRIPPSQFLLSQQKSLMFSSILKVEMMAERKRVTSRLTICREEGQNLQCSHEKCHGKNVTHGRKRRRLGTWRPIVDKPLATYRRKGLETMALVQSEASNYRLIGEPLAFERSIVCVHSAAFSAFPQLRYS